MCPICNSAEYKVIGLPYVNPKLEFLVKEEYKVVKCLFCEYYYVDPKLKFTNDEWSEIYDQEYFGILTNWHYRKRQKDRVQRLKKIENYSASKILNFLDVGCLIESLK